MTGEMQKVTTTTKRSGQNISFCCNNRTLTTTRKYTLLVKTLVKSFRLVVYRKINIRKGKIGLLRNIIRQNIMERITAHYPFKVLICTLKVLFVTSTRGWPKVSRWDMYYRFVSSAITLLKYFLSNSIQFVFCFHIVNM